MRDSQGSIRAGSTIGILGGGQLAQMLVLAGHPLGFKFLVLDPSPSSPAALVGARQLIANYSDPKALKEMAQQCDVVTYEFENVSLDSVTWLEQQVYLPQGSQLLRTSQNRLAEKNALKKLGVPVTPFLEIEEKNQLKNALNSFGKVVLKTVSGGYDGKGQRVIRKESEIEEAFHALYQNGHSLIAEQLINFERELSVIIARTKTGEIQCFAVAENLHEENVLTISRIPARISKQVQGSVQQIAIQIANGLQLVGVMGVEFFFMKNHALCVNEIAPRPHNSGHFSQDACFHSQFDQHLRAIAGWSLGRSDLLSPVVMLNLLGDQLEKILDKIELLPPEAKLHVYGKEECRVGRKMGHLNLFSENLEDLFEPLFRTKVWKPELLESMLV